jgi:hypothetical protein
MSREKLVRARELIEQQRYSEARAILHSIDHPIAHKWLARLDEIAPDEVIISEKPLTKKPRSPRPLPTNIRKERSIPTMLLVALAGVIGFVIGLALGLTLGSSDDGIRVIDVTRQHIIDVNNTTMAEQETATQRALAGPSDFERTSTAIVNRNATTVAEIEATNAALTNVPTQLETTPTEAVPTTQDTDFPPVDENNASSGADNDSPPLVDATPVPTATLSATEGTQSP